MKDLPTVEKFKKLRDKYANEIIPLYANHPYRFLVEDYSRLQDISDEDIDSMDLTTGKDGSHVAYNLLKVLCSTELPGILAQFPSQECAQEAYDLVSAFGGANGSPSLGELFARVFLKYHNDSERLEEIFDSQEDVTDIDGCINSLKQYL